jgi:hypothetical protein
MSKESPSFSYGEELRPACPLLPNLRQNPITPFVFTNYRPPRLTLYKYDPYNDKYIPGATFKIYKVGEEDNSRILC